MTQARTKTTMTESFVEQAKKFGEEMKKAGTNVFHAGLGVVATTEEQARDTFDRMVDKGKDYGSEESRFVSRATREVKELREQVGRRVEDDLCAAAKAVEPESLVDVDSRRADQC